MSDSFRPHESQHARPPCPSPTLRVHSNWCPSSQWCHPAKSSSVVPFSSCPQSLQASGSFPVSQLLAWGGQSTGVSASASFLPKKSQAEHSISSIAVITNYCGGCSAERERRWNFPQQSWGVPRIGEPAVHQPSPSASERQSDSTTVPSKQFHFIATNSWFI